MAYEHLHISREAPQPERHRKKGFPSVLKPVDPKKFGSSLLARFSKFRSGVSKTQEFGFDSRKLLKIKLSDAVGALPEFERIEGIEIISQEDKTVVLAFASDKGLSEFEKRLTTLSKDGTVTRKELLYAIVDFETWTPLDRTGRALRLSGFPSVEPFILDVELWPQELTNQRHAEMAAFTAWLVKNAIEKLDDVIQPSLMMVRVRCTKVQAQLLLSHRDVRTLDLPPRYGIALDLLRTNVNDLTALPLPEEVVSSVAILDSGLSSGHPLLSQAVGDSQGFISQDTSSYDQKPYWHGTFVGGLALYGDIEEAIRKKTFLPQLRLFSGKVFKDDDQDQTEFVEKAIEKAVRQLNDLYGCKVFNLSYGDSNKVYDGRHLRGLAYTLDRLTRELDVLFVVSTGNLHLEDAQKKYPDYLFEETSRLLDPATALNVLTVGGVSNHEASMGSQRNSSSIEDRPVARANEPFPLTRVGPSINGAIKPDFVELAGNVAKFRATGKVGEKSGLGVISLNGDFINGGVFSEKNGTSFAAPVIANKAALLLKELPAASPRMLRALLGVHASWPSAAENLLKVSNNAETKKRLTKVVGYGRVQDSALYRSLNDVVTLQVEESIANDQNHIFELPLPSSLWTGSRRKRQISVGLAYSPEVRTTRLDYRKTKLWFTLVVAESVTQVEAGFKRNREEGLGERDRNRWLSNNDRKNGTLQISRWDFKGGLAGRKKVFVVVTRQDSLWAAQATSEEKYALAVVVSDRESANAQLYQQMKAELQLREQQRTRVRV